MPRIARNKVSFSVNGQPWLATFSHEHNEKTGIPIMLPKGKRPTMVKHVTTVILGPQDAAQALLGISPCSMKDDYDWKLGIKRALNRALESGGHCTIEEIPDTRRVAVGFDLQWNPVYADEKVTKELVHPTPGDPTYGLVMEAFYREMPIKAYPPHNRSVIEGELVPDDLPTGAVPPQNERGLAHTGMD